MVTVPLIEPGIVTRRRSPFVDLEDGVTAEPPTRTTVVELKFNPFIARELDAEGDTGRK